MQQQNQQMQEQLNKQQQLIDSLTRKVAEFQNAGQTPEAEPAKPAAFSKVVISGEGGVAFFESGRDGQYPDAAFRVDEAKLFVDAQIWKDVYFFGELDLTTREQEDDNLSLGELYVDFENVSRLWGVERLVNVRAGRFDIPFGEEYLVRDAIDNPLISHALSDIWGIDEGVELYGSLGKAQYTVAVQNGGTPSVQDYTADKAVVGRVDYDATRWLHLSASAMRTGNIAVEGDEYAALWFGGAQLRSIGPSATTTTFHAELYEGDVQVRWPRGHLKAAGGYLHYDDNNTAANDNRDVYYYYVEGLYDVTAKLYLAMRFSQIRADDGFPIVGNGEYDEYAEEELTADLWQLDIGGGYQFNPNLTLKMDYAFEQGREVGGDERNHENQFAIELAFRI